MSNTNLIIEERSRDIGDFLVGRLIPFRKKRMVGPFIFIDHMGPSTVGPGHYLDIDQHPHIGLSTLTYLFEGEAIHKDSTGANQRITPGTVNWMTAGKGAVHTERTPDDQRDGATYDMHGFQIWVALPKAKQEMEAEFHHISENELPSWNEGGLNMRLVAGEGYGRVSPVPVHSPLFMVEIKANETEAFEVAGSLKGEIGICIVDGSIDACGTKIEKGNMLVSKANDTCNITIEKGSHILLFGGEAFPEERHIYWNFVHTDKDRIEQAKADWKNGQFPMVPGETAIVPLPGS